MIFLVTLTFQLNKMELIWSQFLKIMLHISISLLWLSSSLLIKVECLTLEAVVSNAKLPSTRALMPVTYDGTDNVYIWGGSYGRYSRHDILKYSVSSETVEDIGYDRVGVGWGSGVWVGNNTLLNIGGCTTSGGGWCYDDIWSFNPESASNWTSVANLPQDMWDTTSVWDGKEITYVIGGYASGSVSSILAYSRDTNKIEARAEMPSGRNMAATAMDKRGNLFIFGGRTGTSSGYLNDILKHDPSQNTTVRLGARMPVQMALACAVTAGDFIYIVGGVTNTANSWPPLVKFDPETEEVVALEVRNFPEKLNSAGCAYIEAQNKILIFGGYSQGVYRDEILYISLDGSDPEPSTTTEAVTTSVTTTVTTTQKPLPPVDCSGVDDGTFLPNPYCCESFYQCINWQPMKRPCPDLLQFNPELGQCDYRQNVKCGIFYANA